MSHRLSPLGFITIYYRPLPSITVHSSIHPLASIGIFLQSTAESTRRPHTEPDTRHDFYSENDIACSCAVPFSWRLVEMYSWNRLTLRPSSISGQFRTPRYSSWLQLTPADSRYTIHHSPFYTVHKQSTLSILSIHTGSSSPRSPWTL